MSRCLRCGQDNENTARFCVGCGEQLAAATGNSSSAEDKPGVVVPGAGAGEASAAQEPRPGRSSGTPGASPDTGDKTPGLLPALIVPGSARLDPGDGAESASVEPSRSAAPSANLAFAETAPPVLDADPNRLVADRAAQQPRFDVDPDGPRRTFSPPEARKEGRSASLPPSLDPLSVPADAPKVLSGFLVSYEANALGQSWSVFQGSNLVGRLGAVVGADIELPHATVSSRHAVFQAAAHPGRLFIHDQNSTNGSFVNDTALQPEERCELRDGDRVRFGLFTVIVKII